MVPEGYVSQKCFGDSSKGLEYFIRSKNPKAEGATWLTSNHCEREYM